MKFKIGDKIGMDENFALVKEPKVINGVLNWKHKYS